MAKSYSTGSINPDLSPNLRVGKNPVDRRDSIGRPMANMIKEPTPDNIAARTGQLEPARMNIYQNALQRRLGRL